MLEAFYKALWSRIGGRPWTYILRDTWHQYEGLWILGLIAAGGVGTHFFGLSRVLQGLGMFTVGYIFGHLFWGTRYLPGQRVDSARREKDVE